MHVVAVDAGGTKARFNLYTAQGELRAQAVLPTAHPAQVGLDGMARRLSEGVAEVLAQGGVEPDGAVCSFGLAGYGPGRERPIEQALDEAFPNVSKVVLSDAEIARLGALGGRDGILLIAGTGSIAVGKISGAYRRAGGWGRAFGDEGSGYWIGRRGLEVASKQADGRRPRTSLLKAVCLELGVEEPCGLVAAVQSATDERRLIASIVPVLGDLAAQGDPDALEIFGAAGRELAQLVNALVDGCMPVPCSWAGGVFERGAVIMEPLRAAASEGIEWVEPMAEPIWGAYLAAREVFGNRFTDNGGIDD